MNTHIVEHLATNERLNDSQHGFRHGCSAETNVIDTYDYVTEHLDQAIPVDLFLLDFAKAFDKVGHRRLRSKLFAIGIHNEIVEWVFQFLSGRKQRVKIFGKNGQVFFSEEVEVLSGVPQGTILGPTLFNIYINDAPTTVKNKISLYADDSKLIGTVDTPDKRASMQNDLWALSHWATLWRLEFNVNKCQTIHFGKKNEKCPYHMLGMDGSRQTIISSEVERDLGVIVDNELRFTIHTQTAVAKALKTLGIIKRTITSRSPMVMTKLYKALVRPNLEFGMCVASPLNKGDQQKLETVQRWATKAIEGCKYLNYSSRLKRLKLPTLVYRRKRGDIIMMHKLLNYNSPLNKLFQLDQSARTRGHSRKLYQKRAATRLRNNFFTYRIVSLWNPLTKKAVTTPSTAAFKRAVDGEWSSKPWRTEWDAVVTSNHRHH